jgi:amino acid permease
LGGWSSAQSAFVSTTAEKKKVIDRLELPWKTPFQPCAAWLSLSSFIIILLTSGYTVFIQGQQVCPLQTLNPLLIIGVLSKLE